MSKKFDQKLTGWDAAKVIRQAQAELKAYTEQSRHKADVDARSAQDAPRLEAPVLVVENASGTWTVSSTTSIYPSQKGTLQVTDVTESLAIVEFRHQLKMAMVEDRHCGPEQARRQAALANVWASGRVPFHRIVSR